jgi:diaminohydroxyphosphoribosylaminopyrimidine deaminase/5-amino-6-(5-phosphoribosylamino)uracil reductase
MPANLILSLFLGIYMEADDHLFMQRCLQLAALAGSHAAPNPMVGAVLVHEGRIIGEGYHKFFGGPHAEPECIASVSPSDLHLVQQSTLYVSLEPCAHFGKTPPCADLIISRNIPRVVVGCRDPFPLVAGKGIEKLQAAGIDVTTGIMENECRKINRRFFTFHTRHRPYITLKWAQTADLRIAGETSERVFISNEYTNRMVHKWRTEEMGILIGTRTAMNDDPQLQSRLWPGRQPVRFVIDRELKLSPALKMLDDGLPTIVFNERKHDLSMDDLTKIQDGNWPAFYQVTHDVSLVDQMMHAFYQMKIHSVLVEGGAGLLQSFIDAEAWDEARVITSNTRVLGEGLAAPRLTHAEIDHYEDCFSDTIHYYSRREVK